MMNYELKYAYLHYSTKIDLHSITLINYLTLNCLSVIFHDVDATTALPPDKSSIEHEGLLAVIFK